MTTCLYKTLCRTKYYNNIIFDHIILIRYLNIKYKNWLYKLSAE